MNNCSQNTAHLGLMSVWMGKVTQAFRLSYIKMPGKSGLEAAGELAESWPRRPHRQRDPCTPHLFRRM
jgi:hypothetical protein